MDTMLTAMVNEASPAARRMLGRVKLEGQKKIEKMLNHCITCRAMACASGERWKRVSASLSAKKNADRFMIQAPA